MKLSSKAKTLEVLRPILKYSKILPVYRFLANEYLDQKSKILNQLKSTFDKFNS
jgi:hypothetical protein